jgi:hypothetical protein
MALQAKSKALTSTIEKRGVKLIQSKAFEMKDQSVGGLFGWLSLCPVRLLHSLWPVRLLHRRGLVGCFIFMACSAASSL